MEPVLITTGNRGVFFGYLATPAANAAPASVTLTNARNAIFWDAGVKGVFALAAVGPSAACKVGPAVPELTLYGISTVSVCTPEAAAAWELEPWAEG